MSNTFGGGAAFLNSYFRARQINNQERQAEHQMRLDESRERRAQALHELAIEDKKQLMEFRANQEARNQSSHDMGMAVSAQLIGHRANAENRATSTHDMQAEQHNKLRDRTNARNSLESKLFAEDFSPEAIEQDTVSAMAKLEDGKPVNVTHLLGDTEASDLHRGNSGDTAGVFMVPDQSTGEVVLVSQKRDGRQLPYTVNPKDNDSPAIRLTKDQAARLYFSNLGVAGAIALEKDPAKRKALREAQAKKNANIKVGYDGRLRSGQTPKKVDLSPVKRSLQALSGNFGREQGIFSTVRSTQAGTEDRSNIPEVQTRTPAQTPKQGIEEAAKATKAKPVGPKISEIVREPSKLTDVVAMPDVQGAPLSEKAQITAESLKVSGSVPAAKFRGGRKPTPALIKELKEGIEKGYWTGQEARNVIDTGRMDTSLADLQRAGFESQKAQVDYLKSIAELNKAVSEAEKAKKETKGTARVWDEKTLNSNLDAIGTIVEDVGTGMFGADKYGKEKTAQLVANVRSEFPDLIRDLGFSPDDTGSLNYVRFVKNMTTAWAGLNKGDYKHTTLYPAAIVTLSGLDYSSEDTQKMVSALVQKAAKDGRDLRKIAVNMRRNRAILDSAKSPEERAALQEQWDQQMSSLKSYALGRG